MVRDRDRGIAMAETNDILEVAKMTISASIKRNTVRGFIGWHSCDNICMDMHDVLDICKDAFQQERYQESLEADTYVLVSGVKLASCADSSSGMLTDVIRRAFELIDLSTQTIAKLDAAMREHALSLIIKEAKNKAFDGWDSWRYELLEKAVCLCDEKWATKLEKLLDTFLEDIENDNVSEYQRQEDTILRYKLHRHIKGADAVKDELYANLYIKELCIIAVKDATDARNYNEAEKLCLEQIKKENGHFYTNTPENWNNILFDVYMQSGIIDKQIEQAKKILLLGNEGFWDVLKRLYQSQGTWESQRPILLKELKQSKYSVCYQSVLVKENEKKLLLESVTEDSYYLFYYAQFLVKDYPNEIYELCANYVREQCAQATERRLYKKVCKNLLQLIKWKANATVKQLVDEFKATYRRRSALLDELQKVEKKL